MSDPDLILKDWEMTKDRIKHFDDVVTRLRLQGIPIGTAIQAIGFASFQYVKTVNIGGISATSLIVAMGSIYLIPIFFLDLFHYNLMLISVRHAKEIEALPKYKDKLQITTKLTSRKLTILHTVCAIIVYCGVIAMGFVLAYFINTLPTD
jgi:uncharacterized membrane-anchored protein YitT (DUF2179 family)